MKKRELISKVTFWLPLPSSVLKLPSVPVRGGGAAILLGSYFQNLVWIWGGHFQIRGLFLGGGGHLKKFMKVAQSIHEGELKLSVTSENNKQQY